LIDDAQAGRADFSTLLVYAAKKEPANYWFDRRHVEQFDVRVQSLQTAEGEVLTLLRVLDQKMIDIYG
jgi:hypothetical protein